MQTLYFGGYIIWQVQNTFFGEHFIVNLYVCVRVCSCCVDEVAADHVNADAIIHFGTACLTV